MKKPSLTQPVDTKTIILNEAVRLFAKHGYSDVSMRDIAEAVGIRAPALYNHFTDKQNLYLAAVSQAFAEKNQAFSELFSKGGTPAQQLEKFVYYLCESVGNDPDFRRLLQREVLDGDEARLRVLAKNVFEEQFLTITRLAKQLAPTCDAHMLTISIAGLVLHHFEFGPLRRFFPGSRAEHEDPKYIAKHVVNLLFNGLDGRNHKKRK